MSDMLGKEVREVKDELVAFKTSTLTELANFKLDIAKELRSTKWQTLGLMVGPDCNICDNHTCLQVTPCPSLQ